MAKKEFPCSPCDVCMQPFNNLKEGFLIANNFQSILQRTYEGGYQSNEKLIDAITKEYFLQFKNIFMKHQNSNPINLGSILEDIHIDMNASQYRLEKVIEKCPDKFVFLTTHDKCAPEKLIGCSYDIPLTEIDAPEKALEWTFRLNEKIWFNPKGWIHTLEKLYGRGNV